MTTFVQSPFWAQGTHRGGWWPHAVSVLVGAVSFEPITLADAKARCRITTPDEDGLIWGFVKAARAKVELDTGLALPQQTRDVYLDSVRGDVIDLPAQCRPLISVTSVKTTDTAGTQNTLATTEYIVDTASARIGLSVSGSWPTDLRYFQPWVIRVVVGWASAAALPPLLVHAVGLLVSHYATVGRDLTTTGTIITTTPEGYEDAIAAYRTVTLA